jgi:hypothetical protein
MRTKLLWEERRKQHTLDYCTSGEQNKQQLPTDQQGHQQGNHEKTTTLDDPK